MPLKINVVTIFPEFFAGPLGLSIPARAKAAGGVEYNLIDLRDYTHDKHKTVDDAPYGGGAGMVIRVDVVCAALEATYGEPIERVLEDTGYLALATTTPSGRWSWIADSMPTSIRAVCPAWLPDPTCSR